MPHLETLKAPRRMVYGLQSLELHRGREDRPSGEQRSGGISRLLCLFKERLREMILDKRAPLPAVKVVLDHVPLSHNLPLLKGLSDKAVCARCHQSSCVPNLLNVHGKLLVWLDPLHLDFLL